MPGGFLQIAGLSIADLRAIARERARESVPPCLSRRRSAGQWESAAINDLDGPPQAGIDSVEELLTGVTSALPFDEAWMSSPRIQMSAGIGRESLPASSPSLAHSLQGAAV